MRVVELSASRVMIAGPERDWRGVWMPIVVGAGWLTLGGWFSWTWSQSPMPMWSAVSMGIAAAGGLPVILIGLLQALTVARVDLNAETGRGSWTRRWRWGGVRLRTTFLLAEVGRVELRKRTIASGRSGASAGGQSTTHAVRVWLREPKRVLTVFETEDGAAAERVRSAAGALVEHAAALRSARGEADSISGRGEPGDAPSLALGGRLEAALARELEAGEQVRWSSRAHARSLLRAGGLWATTLFGFVWLGLVVGGLPVMASSWLSGVGMSAAAAQAIGWVLAAAVGWPGAAFASAPVWGPALARRTGYAVTDRRAIRVELGWFGGSTCTAWPLARAKSARIERDPDGTGSVVLKGEGAESEGLIGVQSPDAVLAVIRGAD